MACTALAIALAADMSPVMDAARDIGSAIFYIYFKQHDWYKSAYVYNYILITIPNGVIIDNGLIHDETTPLLAGHSQYIYQPLKHPSHKNNEYR